MELRHLETLLAIAEHGSFTAAADVLNTVQSNVSEQIRQLESELGASLLVRSRRGAVPTECGEVVINRSRRIWRELEAMRVDLSVLVGLEGGSTTFGIVGTAGRWLVPALVAELRVTAPGVHLRVQEGASERLVAEVLSGELVQAIVTEPVQDRRLVVVTLVEEALVAVVPEGRVLPLPPVPLSAVAPLGLVLPPPTNPLRREVEAVAAAQGVVLDVMVEVEGIRLIADLVAAGAGASVLPPSAIPSELSGLRAVPLLDFPPRRLALVHARDTHLSIADRAVRDLLFRLIDREAASEGKRDRKAV